MWHAAFITYFCIYFIIDAGKFFWRAFFYRAETFLADFLYADCTVVSVWWWGCCRKQKKLRNVDEYLGLQASQQLLSCYIYACMLILFCPCSVGTSSSCSSLWSTSLLTVSVKNLWCCCFIPHNCLALLSEHCYILILHAATALRRKCAVFLLTAPHQGCLALIPMQLISWGSWLKWRVPKSLLYWQVSSR